MDDDGGYASDDDRDSVGNARAYLVKPREERLTREVESDIMAVDRFINLFKLL